MEMANFLKRSSYKDKEFQNDDSEEMAKALFDQIDKENIGYIDIKSFVGEFLCERKIDHKDLLVRIFKMLDINGNGNIKIEQLNNFLL